MGNLEEANYFMAEDSHRNTFLIKIISYSSLIKLRQNRISERDRKPKEINLKEFALALFWSVDEISDLDISISDL